MILCGILIQHKQKLISILPVENLKILLIYKYIVRARASGGSVYPLYIFIYRTLHFQQAVFSLIFHNLSYLAIIWNTFLFPPLFIIKTILYRFDEIVSPEILLLSWIRLSNLPSIFWNGGFTLNAVLLHCRYNQA